MILAVDSSTRYGGVALADERGVISCRMWYSTANHTVELMPAVAGIIRGHEVTVGALTGIVVALGPGRFSALRVGISVAKGLAIASGVPLAGVGTLDLEAYPYLESGLPVCALLEAGRGEAASAHFGSDGRRLREDLVSPPNELLASISEPTLFCGEGAAAWRGAIRDGLGPLGLLVARPAPAARLWSLAALGSERLVAGDVSDLATLQPSYLRMPSIGGPKRRDWVPQRS